MDEKMTGPNVEKYDYTRQNEICSDCGEKGTDYGLCGDLLPESEISDQRKPFCAFCYKQRSERLGKREPQLPLGVKPPGVPKEFLNKAISVKTESGSVYEFGVPDGEGIRNVSAMRGLSFTRCKIFLANIGKPMWLRIVDDPEEDSSHVVESSPVKSIEALS